MNTKYTLLEIAVYFKSENLKISDQYGILDYLWEKRADVLEDIILNSKKQFYGLINEKLYSLYRYNKDIDDINIIFNELECSYSLPINETHENTIESYFKVIKLRLEYTPNRDYYKIKLRTLIKQFGYKRRSAALIQSIETTMSILGLEARMRGNQICNLGTVSLDRIILIRLISV